MSVEELDVNQFWVTGEVRVTNSMRLQLMDTIEPGVRLLFRWVSAGVREAGDMIGEVHKPDEVIRVLQDYGLQ